MTKVKICGLKTLDDVEAVNLYKPDYIGFVFANTRRFLTDEEAFTLKQALSKDIQAVGVFVDEPIDHILSLCDRNIIDMVQLHGEETEAYIRELKQKTDKPVIKAVKVQNKEQVKQEISKEADYMLFDTYKKGVLGGTGERFPLEILEQCLQEWKQENNTVKPYFLAGGLTPENVSEVLSQVSCYCVDVSSGVETGGKKDKQKIEAFINRVK